MARRWLRMAAATAALALAACGAEGYGQQMGLYCTLEAGTSIFAIYPDAISTPPTLSTKWQQWYDCDGVNWYCLMCESQVLQVWKDDPGGWFPLSSMSLPNSVPLTCNQDDQKFNWPDPNPYPGAGYYRFCTYCYSGDCGDGEMIQSNSYTIPLQ